MEHSTEWVNSFIIVEKDVSMDNGNSHAPCHQTKKKLQICLDPRDLNEALEHEPYYLRSVDELIGKFHGCKEERLLDGHTLPRFKAFNLHVNRHRKIPMDMTSKGNSCCF